LRIRLCIKSSLCIVPRLPLRHSPEPPSDCEIRMRIVACVAVVRERPLGNPAASPDSHRSLVRRMYPSA
jgi:hypothetical protein